MPPLNPPTPANRSALLIGSQAPDNPSTPAQTPQRTSQATVSRRSNTVLGLQSPGNPLAPFIHRKQHRNGYEATPPTPSFRPFALNNPGAPRQQAFNISKPTRLEPLEALILVMQHDINSFLDLAFVLPLGCREVDVDRTIIYTDDLDLLTQMFWWGYARAASMGIPTRVIDIVHSGLSDRHNEMALNAFRDGTTSILLGSSKISAG